jgi:hypothetical protein
MKTTTYTLTISHPDGHSQQLRFTDTQTYYRVLFLFEGMSEPRWIKVHQEDFAKVAHETLTDGGKILDIEEIIEKI